MFDIIMALGVVLGLIFSIPMMLEGEDKYTLVICMLLILNTLMVLRMYFRQMDIMSKKEKKDEKIEQSL